MLGTRLERFDDAVVELGADEPKLVTAIDERLRERAAHHAGAEDRDARHQPPVEATGLV
jgi:hypothetical protein